MQRMQQRMHQCTNTPAKGGIHKDELIQFCKTHKIQFKPKSTKAELCKVVSKYFAEHVDVNDKQENGFDKKTNVVFGQRSCNANKKGDGKTEWRVAELRQLMIDNGWPLPKKVTKASLCKALSENFEKLKNQQTDSEQSNQSNQTKQKNEALSIENLRKLCVKRGLKGCKQTRKRETFLQKLKDVSGAQSEKKVSIGHKDDFEGNLTPEFNTIAANLASIVYLLKSHSKQICIPLKPEYLEDPSFGKNHYCDFQLCWTYIMNEDASTEYFFEWSYVGQEEAFWEDIQMYCETRFAVIPMYITGIVGDKQLSHHNYVVFDREAKTVERFEPNGSMNIGSIIGQIYGEEKLNSIFSESAKKHDYRYISPLEFCPLIGPQAMEEYQYPEQREGDPLGFCTFWSLWYADRRLKYPDIPVKELIEKLVDGLTQEKKQLRTFIRNYTEYIDKERRELVKLMRKETGETDEQIVVRALIEKLAK